MSSTSSVLAAPLVRVRTLALVAVGHATVPLNRSVISLCEMTRRALAKRARGFVKRSRCCPLHQFQHMPANAYTPLQLRSTRSKHSHASAHQLVFQPHATCTRRESVDHSGSALPPTLARSLRSATFMEFVLFARGKKSVMKRKAWISNAIALVLTAALLPAADSSREPHPGRRLRVDRPSGGAAAAVAARQQQGRGRHRQSNSCAENIEQLPTYKLLRTKWQNQGVEVPDVECLARATTSHPSARPRKPYDIDFPIMVDESQLVAENLNVAKAGEVLVIEPKSRQVLYRGPLDRAAMRRLDDGEARPGATARQLPKTAAQPAGRCIAAASSRANAG